MLGSVWWSEVALSMFRQHDRAMGLVSIQPRYLSSASLTLTCEAQGVHFGSSITLLSMGKQQPQSEAQTTST